MAQQMLPPWSNFPIPGHVREEFKRRAGYGLNIADVKATGKYSTDYRGTMSAWIRLCSNAKLNYSNGSTIDGFVFSRGNVGFYENYGINNNSLNINPQKLQVIGYQKSGSPITIENISGPTTLQKFRPPPVIDNITVNIKNNICRSAIIKWKCFSLQQLERMLPFFFTPYVTVLVEWGWNNFSPNSLIDLQDPGKTVQSYKNGKYGLLNDNNKIVDVNGDILGKGIKTAYFCPEIFENGTKISGGNYDGLIGKIVTWKYEFNDSDYSFDCTTEIVSASKFQNSMLISVMNSESTTSKKKPQTSLTTSLTEYFEKNFYKNVFSWETMTEQEFGANNKLKDLTYADRLCTFDPREYVNASTPFKGDSVLGDSKKKYVALKIFFDELNAFISVQPKNKTNDASFYKIIYDTEIGANPNMISCDPDILIPNKYAPFYYPESLINDTLIPKTQNFLPHPDLKKPLNQNSVFDEDVQLNNVLKSKMRQDLNSVINYKSAGADGLAFPSISDQNTGLLRNIYISTDMVKDLCKEESIENLIDKLCNRLNAMFPMWKLEKFLTDMNINIKDMNYLSISDISIAKAQFGLSSTDQYLYYFEPFSQESIAKNFKFGVELKDSVAGMIINKAQHDNGQTLNKSATPTGNIATGIPASIENAYISSNLYDLSDPINDDLKRIDDQIKIEVESKKTDAERKKIVDNSAALLQGKFKKIKDDALGFIKQSGTSQFASLLMIPGDYRDKVLSLLSTPYGGNATVNNSPMPGTSIEFSVLGIGGFKLYQIFAVNNLPEPYKNKVVFQIMEIKHQIENNDWVVTIVCNVRPVGSIKKTFG